jgi:serine/threonine protein phosphatase PrpC
MTPKKAPMYHETEWGPRGALRSSLERALKQVTKPTQTVEDSLLGVVVGSTIGPRRQRNEDRVCAVTISKGPAAIDQLFVALVCDGIGGHPNGEESAWTAASAFIAECALSNAATPNPMLRDAALAADRVVYARNRGQGGTTLVALLLFGDGQLGLINCGDSRLYKTNRDGKLIQLSHDQTIGAAIHGAAASAPVSTAFDSELGNYIGIGPDITPEFIELSHVAKDDVFILSTDGTWGALGDLFSPILLAAPSANEAVRRVLATVNFANGGDNASLAIISSYELLRSALHKKTERLNAIEISGITPNGSFFVSASRAQPPAPDVRRPTVETEQTERSRIRKKGARPRQTSFALDRGEADQTADQKKKRKGGGKVIVVGGKDGDAGENDN